MLQSHDSVRVNGCCVPGWNDGCNGVRDDGQEEKFTIGKELEYDADNMRVTNCSEADQYIRKIYRNGWILNG